MTDIDTLVATISLHSKETQTPDVFLVEFEKDDPRDPFNFSFARKWAITLTACWFSVLTGVVVSSYSLCIPSIIQDLNCSWFQAVLGISLYALMYGIVPLFASPISEEFGRRPVYIFSTIMFTLAQVMAALSPNITVLLVARVLCGVFGSAGGIIVGGSVADIFKPQDRGVPMVLFASSLLFSFGAGGILGGLIASAPHFGWRWVQWAHVITSGVYAVFAPFVLCETRPSVILTSIARSMRKHHDDQRYCAKAEMEKQSLLRLIVVACVRPIYFLLTEPIVQCFSLWLGFTWGVLLALIEAVSPMYSVIYGFNLRQTGFVFGALCVGAVLGFLGNLLQDKIYHEYAAQRQQEARLYSACVAGLLLPAGMLTVAWTASNQVHWIVPTTGLAVFMTGAVLIVHVSFLYISDCYNTYASSANASQSLFRNIIGMILPLFITHLFRALSYRWGLTLIGGVGALLAPIPFVLLVFGSSIRAQSYASRKILESERRNSTASTLSTWSYRGGLHGQGLPDLGV